MRIYKKNRVRNYRRPAVLFTYGRMQPPHPGHKKLIQSLLNKAKSSKVKTDVVVALSHSQNIHKHKRNPGRRENPLTVAEKEEIVNAMIGDLNIPKNVNIYVNASSSSRLLPSMMSDLSKGYQNVNMVVGKNRLASFRKMTETLRNKTNGEIDINVSSINRNNNGISATEIRTTVVNNNRRGFASRMDPSIPNNMVTTTFDRIRSRMTLPNPTV